MNKHKLALAIKKKIIGPVEKYRFAGKKLKFFTGTRPIKRKYVSSKSDVVRNDVLQINYFERNFKPNDVLWDIGSHHGHYSIFAASVVRGEKQVFSFEPDKTAYNLQSRNIALNAMQDRIELFSIAVAGIDGTVLFDSQEGNANSHISKESKGGGERLISINAKTMNTLFEELPNPSFVKIDTEGAEIDILKAADRLLADTSVKFICELHPFAWGNFGVYYYEFVSILQKHNRTIHLLDDKKDLSELPFYGTVLF